MTLLTVFVALSAVAFATDSVAVQTHPFPVELAQVEIDSMFATGMIPVAMQVDRTAAISMAYTESPHRLAPTGWLLYQLSSLDVVEEEVTAIIQAGYVPVDLSFDGEDVYFLFLESEVPVREWRLTADRFSRARMSEIVATHRDAGFTLEGLAFQAGMLWHLFVRYDEPAIGEIELVFIDNQIAAIEADAASRAGRGATLVTFAPLPGDLVLIGYAR